MTDLFTKQYEICVHKASNTHILIIRTEWFKGELSYDCLVPMEEEKGRWELCNATYTEADIEIINN